MSNFPSQIDSNAELPQVDDNLTDIGDIAINALRSAMFAVESNIGINAQGSTGSIAQRLSISLNPDGTIKPSALVGIGLVVLPITDAQVSPTAGIQESKLNLVYSTSSLYTLILTLQNSIDVLNGFLSLTGVKLEPHIDGTAYNHFLSAIRVDQTTPFVKTNPAILPSAGTNVVNRNTTNSDLLVQDISNDLVVHEKSDGSVNVTPTSGGTVPPSNFAHMASGVYVVPTNFSTIPQSNNNVQSIIEYFDNSSLLLLGSRTQNLYANGISRTSRSSSFFADGYGEPIVPPTPAISYFLNVPPGPMASSPVDDFSRGDDVVLFQPTAQQLNTFNFDAQFAQVQPGDLLTINYGTGVSYQFVIDSIKSKVSGTVRTYAVRINGKNPISDINALARIDRSTFHRGKYGVLASARSPNYTGVYESLIISSPKSATALGNGYNPSEFDSNHYNLYLTLLPTGDVSTIISLPAIDVTGNKGATPGQYTLDKIVENTNIAFRTPGFNFRFVAFQYAGQFGIMLADPYNNASFAISSGTVDGYGNYTSSSLSGFPDNVVDNFNLIDPLGIGFNGSNVASPPPSIAYSTVASAMFNPTLLFYPLKRNFFYTNGVERDSLKSDPIILNNILDSYGDGYWPATILPPPYTNVLPNRVEVVYKINLDLSASGLRAGKTVVIQPAFPSSDPRYNFRDYGRFVIKDVSFNNCSTPSAYTNITVYDGVHGAGTSPAVTSNNIPTFVYFSDDSVSFDAENIFDTTTSGPFKRFFEVYVDSNGHTFTHERARFVNTNADISNINFYKVSPKLRGYAVNNDKEIRLTITAYDQITGIYTGYLARWNPISLTISNVGQTAIGKKGEIVRFYDETNIDYIDFTIDINQSLSSFSNKTLDVQLFKTLELDEEIMLLSSCQVNDITKQISYLKDERQFGNVSEEQFTSSALDYISASNKLLDQNGIINGFDNQATSINIISFNGGTALINGKIIFINETSITIPALIEALFPAFTTTINTITWFICANKKSEIEIIASTDYPLSSTGIYGAYDQNRIFYVTNPSSGMTYPVRATYFNNLVSNYTDVVPLYIATSVVSGTSISSLIVTDARRFVSNGYSGTSDSFILSTEGQFRTVDSVNSWISQLTKYISYANTANNTKGVNIDSRGKISFITSNIVFDYPVNVNINGNNSRLEFDTSIVSLNNNLSFSNIIIDASFSTLTIGNNISFKNCTINFPSALTFTGTNISFENCIITFPNIAIILSADLSFINCTINVSSSITNGINTTYNNCIINISSGVGLILSNNNTFVECTINYTYDATSDVAFVSTNLANTSKACLIGNVSNSGLSDIIIDNCSFSSPNVNRFTFISIIFSSVSTNAENISIINNKFNTTYNSDDKSAVVAFVAPNTVHTGITGLRLTNCFIQNNHCNKNQLIMISSLLSVGSQLVVEALVAVNVKIEGNTCGAISVLTKRDIPATTYGGFVLDKEDGIYINKNTCKFIYSGFADGFAVSSTNVRGINNLNTGLFTGSMYIEDNICSFIHTGCRTFATSYTAGTPLLKIKNNKLTAVDISSSTGFLNIYYRNFIAPANPQTATAMLIDRVPGT